MGWLFISHNGPQEGPLPESPLLPDESSRLTVLALGVSPENELSLCALLSFQPDLIAVQVAALPPKPFGRPRPARAPSSAAWQQGGAAYLQSVLSQWLGISIHRTISQNRQQLSAVMEQFGPLPYTLPLSLAEDAPAAASCSRLGATTWMAKPWPISSPCLSPPIPPGKATAPPS